MTKHGSDAVLLRSSAAGMALIAVLSVSACSGSDADADVSSVAGALPAKDIDRWVMPVDQYVPQHQLMLDYAENVLVSECMAAAGYTWAVPAFDIHAPASPTSNAVNRQLFGQEIAATWGYLPAPSTQQNAAAQEAAVTQPLPEGSDDQFWQCVSDVRADQLPPASSEAMNFASSLGMAADQAVRVDSDVLAAADRWSACMEPLGISDLPDVPSEMPSESLRSQFGRGERAAEAVPPAESTASAREIEIATFDAACRDSSGWSEARYEAEWELQVTAVQQNVDVLERILDENREVEERALAVLAERGLG
ncbi:hypothetical protein ACGIF2_11075 [Cellulomonas sp. P22]|uniref:hypothetical protein n=1 Tax=Cellulomonas sp. P22 TaxID=3373189 RepID=UPI0037A5E02F